MKRIKYLISLCVILFFVSSFTGKAQTYEMKYSYTTDPFQWKINKIEGEDDFTYVYLTVKNTAFDKRALNFSTGEFAVTQQYPSGIKAYSNSVVNSKNFNLFLSHGQEVPIVLKFATTSILTAKEFDLKIAKYFTIPNIRIPDLTLADVNKQMQTWEQYYYANRKVLPTYKNGEDLKNAIQSEVENWQKKGEFESTAAWKGRVNDASREEFIRVSTNNYVAKYEREQQAIKQEQASLARDYEKYKEEILKKFYNQKKAIANNEFAASIFELMPYDADNETFLIHNSKYGDILLPVPVSDAPSFKQNWDTIKLKIQPKFVPNGDDVALTKLVFTNNYKSFVYDSHTNANYAITDVKYNFAPIDIADINIANLKIDGVSDIPNGVSSKVLGKTSSDVLTAQNAQIERINVSASDKSNVDIAIPQNKTDNNTHTFAVIIANENYYTVSDVPYAEKDGEILVKYLTRTVGLPKEYVKFYKNASYGNIAAALKHIENLSEAFGNDLNLILYYAGHGMPNEKTKSPMLIPVDGDAAIPETCYDLDKVISTLGSLNANSVVVMLDACFSGTERGDGMLMAARGIRIKSNQAEPIGNMVILSASQGDETAYPFETEQHGLFTYYLLKKLQDTKGDVTLGELSDYIIDQVKRQSVVSNGKLQTPHISVSSNMQTSWRSRKLK